MAMSGMAAKYDGRPERIHTGWVRFSRSGSLCSMVIVSKPGYGRGGLIILTVHPLVPEVELRCGAALKVGVMSFGSCLNSYGNDSC